MSGFKTVEMRSLIKTILSYYIERQQLKQQVKDAFLKHYRLKEIIRGEKILRVEVHSAIENELRRVGSPNFRHFQAQCLKEIGVVPSYSKGYRYYQGIERK